MHEKTVDLQNRLMKFLRDNLPIKAGGKVLNITDVAITEPEALNDIGMQMQMKYSGNGDLKGWLRGRVVIEDEATHAVISKSRTAIDLIPVHYVTDRGTYIINGSEKNILSQMRLKPGSYTARLLDKNGVRTNIMFDNAHKGVGGKFMPQIIVNFDPVDMDFKVDIKQSGDQYFNGVNFMRALGFTDQEIVRAIGNDNISDVLMDKARNTKTVNDIYKAVTNKATSESPDKTRLALFEYLNENAKFGPAGQGVIKSNLGVNVGAMTKEVIFRTIQKTFAVSRGEVEPDDKDDLRYKEVLDDNDLIMDLVEKEFAKFKEDAINVLNSKDTKVSNLRTLTKLGNNVDKFFSQSGLVNDAEQTNPLFIASINRRVTQLGGGGGLTSEAAQNEKRARNLKSMGVNRIDPIETPESGNIGLIEHLSQSAEIKNRTIVIPVLKMNDGVAIDNKANTVKLDPDDEYDAYVAFFDTRYVKKEGDKIVCLKKKVPARYHGQNIMADYDKIQYVDTAPQNLFNFTANSIPFVHHDDGNRALMGTNMQRQAILLKNREVPLVSASVNGTSKTYEELIGEQYGKPIKAEADGIVSDISDSVITVKGDDGTLHKQQYYHYFPLNQSFINNDLLVKKGDKVKKGQTIAEGWQTKDGKLALGINARIGYLPYKGYNYEDGVVIRRGFADKMATEEVEEKEVIVKDDWVGGRGSGALEKFREYVSANRGEIFSRLDADGIIKVGEHVKPGDIVAGFLKPERQQESLGVADLFGAIDKGSKYRFDPTTIEPTSYVSGTVERISVVNNPEPGVRQKIIITLTTSKPLKLGDKISGKHGNKGTITKILPDDEMPVVEDGRALDLIFSPLAVPSRKNVGQLYETSAGLIAEKTGKSIVVNNFDHKEAERIQKGLVEIGYPDGKMKVVLKEKQPDGHIKEIPVDNPITTGDMYIMKLKHKVDEKIQARSNREGKGPELITNMPSKTIGQAQGEKHNPQSFGEMEMRALQAHGAIWNILESSTIKADGGGDTHQRIAFFNALATGKLDNLDMPATPETVKVMADSLKALGLNVTPVNNGAPAKSFDDAFDSLTLHPMKPSEMIKLVGKNNEVTRPSIYNAKVDGRDEPVRDGLVDPRIFGEKGDSSARTKWGYVKLGTPMPNPVLLHDPSFNPYSVLTGVSKDELVGLMKGQKVVIIDPEKYDGYKGLTNKKILVDGIKHNMAAAGLKPGDTIEPSKLEHLMDEHGDILWKAGGEGLQHMLDQVDVNQELKKAEAELKEAKGEKIDKAYKKVKTLQMLKNNNMQASDLMWHYVPVAPTYMRPVLSEGKDIIYDDLNKLYRNLIIANNPIKENYENGFDMLKDANPVDAARDTRSLYNTLTNLTGRTSYKDFKTGKDVKSLQDMLGGKEALIRGKMLSKRVDFSGRSVIGVSPDLKMNEAGVPIDMAKYLYRPFILKELLHRGMAKNMDEADKMWKKSDTNPEIQQIIQEIADDRPILMNRQPSLHKFSVQAFKPVIMTTQDGEAVRSLQLNPMVVTGFNADFDGDTMAIHVPITERATEEAKKLMMPSENLINPTNGSMVVEIRHEMALGIFYLTLDWNKGIGSPTAYTNYQQLRKDYKDGKLKVRQNVSLNGVTATAGQMMFNMLLPEKYRDFKKTWSSGDIQKALLAMHKDSEQTNGKAMSKMDISRVIDNIKALGFEAATRSGVSIGLKDFKKVEGVQEMVKKNIAEAKQTHSDAEEATIAGWRKTEEEIEQKLKKGEILEEDNPLNIMMASGARAKPDQIRRMMGVVGVGRDVTSRLTAPVEHSHFEGLSPEEYWLHSYDSRKGMYDRTVSTSEPGTITREVWSAVQDVIIKEKDCGTIQGIDIAKNKSTILGRFAAETIRGKNGQIYARRNEMITEEVRQKIYADESIKTINVRSPLKCRSVGGVCQRCYGAVPGTMQLPAIGTPVGVLASQAMGEPVTQMTMNTFHSGGTSSSATLGLPRIEHILDLSKDKANEAVLAKVSGKVTAIKKGIRGTFDTVVINGIEHKIPHLDNGENKHLRVEVGDNVTKGDFLTYGDLSDIAIEMPNKQSTFLITNASPKDMFKLKAEALGQDEALDYTQNYLVNSMDYAFTKTIGADKLDQRHMETIIGKMTSKVRVIDPGDSSFTKGEHIDKNLADRWNAENTGNINKITIPVAQARRLVGKHAAETYKDKKGNVLIHAGDSFTNENIPKLIMAKINNVHVTLKPITYQVEINSKDTVVTKGHSNWLSNMGHEDVYQQLARGATFGQADKLNDPRSRLMTGKLLNVGEGFSVPKEKANSISTRMFNLFSKMK